MPASRPPKYSRAKEKNRADRAYVWLDGKKVFLGIYGSSESKQRYTELLANVAEVGTAESTQPARDQSQGRSKETTRRSVFGGFLSSRHPSCGQAGKG